MINIIGVTNVRNQHGKKNDLESHKERKKEKEYNKKWENKVEGEE